METETRDVLAEAERRTLVDNPQFVAGRVFARLHGVPAVTDTDTRFQLTAGERPGTQVVELYDHKGTYLATVRYADYWWQVEAAGATATVAKSCRTFSEAMAAAQLAHDLASTPLPPPELGRERPATLEDLVELCPGYGWEELRTMMAAIEAAGGTLTLLRTPHRVVDGGGVAAPLDTV